jgi:hypothetical protein
VVAQTGCAEEAAAATVGTVPRLRAPLGLLLAVALGLAVAAAAAGGIRAATTDTTTDTTATAPTETAVVTVTTETTATVQTTVQQTVTTVTPVTTAPAQESTSSSSSGFPTWAIVLIVAVGIGLIVAVAFLLGRGTRSADSSMDGRRRILDAAVSSAVASGWTVESTGPVEAVIRHNGDRAMLTVDEHGQVTRRPLEGGERPD